MILFELNQTNKDNKLFHDKHSAIGFAIEIIEESNLQYLQKDNYKEYEFYAINKLTRNKIKVFKVKTKGEPVLSLSNKETNIETTKADETLLLRLINSETLCISTSLWTDNDRSSPSKIEYIFINSNGNCKVITDLEPLIEELEKGEYSNILKVETKYV